ncbi:MAG: glycosyltransferase family 4 protein [Candidatus Parcubacteria bacterium]|nr:glycosyltransferase family 4 protein [Candidatus Parcubacteria bacterium]
MRKTLLITIDFPPQKGGVATYLSNICHNLEYDKIVVLANKQNGSEHFDNKQGYKIIRARLFNRFFWPAWFRTLRLAKKVIRQEKVEQILISHVLPMGYIALLLKLPFIVSLHGFDVLAAQKTAWKKYWLLKILNQAKAIIVNSKFTENEVSKLAISSDKISIVYPCPNIKPEDLNSQERQTLKTELELHSKKVLLSVGRMVPRKGFDKVIEALPEVIEKIPNLVYLLVGNGKRYLDDLEILAIQKQVLDHVTICEDIPDTNLPSFYDLADVFIMPARQIGSDVEGFGIVYLEANSFGKPVIAGKSGGASEAVIDGQTGILVDPENVSQIAKVIINLMTDQEYAIKLGAQGKERVLSEFQWDKQVAKLRDIL